MLSPLHELLLDAALATDRRALDAWTRVAQQVQRLDPGARRLLPLIASNLLGRGTEVERALPARAELESALEQTFLANAAYVGHALPVLRELAARGLRVALLKGVSLAEPVYGDWGTRTLSDIDVLVDAAAVETACAVLQQAGFAPFPDTWKDFPRSLRLDHAQGFASAGGGRLDLHWSPLHAFPWDGWAEDHWRHAEPAHLQDLALLRLAPADELFIAAIHGAHDRVHHGRSGAQSVADVVMLTRAVAQRIDWTRVCELARTRGFTRTLRQVLAYAAERFAAPIPRHVESELAAAGASRAERIEAAALRLPAEAREIGCELARYTRMRGAPRYRPLAGGLVRFLTDAWSLEHSSQLPGELAHRIAGKFRAAWTRRHAAADS